jgi:Contractile injection system tape measure protein
MSQQNHIIGRTVLEIDIDRLDDAWSFQAEISDILQQQGIPAMAQLFDRLVGDERTIRLDRLVVELAPIDRHFLADEFVRNLLDALNLTLTDRLADRLPIDSAETKIQARSEADWEVFLYFLQYGRLPWWCPTADWQTWLPRWEAVMQTGGDWQVPLRALLDRDPSAQRRLIAQFDPGFRHQLVLQLQPTWFVWTNLLSQAQQLIQAVGLSRSNSEQLETQAWLLLLTELGRESSLSRPFPTADWIRAWLTDLVQIWRSTASEQTLTPQSSETSAPSTPTIDPDSTVDRVSIEPQAIFYQRLRTIVSELPSAEKSQWLTALLNLAPPQENSLSQQTRWQSLSERESPDRAQSDPSDLRLAAQTTDPEVRSLVRTEDVLSQIEIRSPATHRVTPPAQIQRSSDSQISPAEATAGLFVDRAGLVILHPFLSPYFAEVGLLNGNEFRDEIAQQTAIYLLHYLATGQTDAPESELVIPKLLCGLHLNAPVVRGIELPAAALTEGENLLQTAIDYWQVLKNTSPDGLREGFLQRGGKLTLQDDNSWRLQVEQQSIDVLLGSLPWGINVIKLPWLECLIMVEWS